MLIIFAIAILAQMIGINISYNSQQQYSKNSGLGSNYVAILGDVTITVINFSNFDSSVYSR
ncbi:MAG: hypothetical protein AB8V10_05060 [Francisella endosymbiont of Hyalomma asiaticum]